MRRWDYMARATLLALQLQAVDCIPVSKLSPVSLDQAKPEVPFRRKKQPLCLMHSVISHRHCGG